MKRAARSAEAGHLRQDRGGVAIEFVLIMPVLLLLAVGAAEIVRFVTLEQKLARAATAAADLVSRGDTVSEDDLIGAFDAAAVALQPFEFGERGGVSISAVSGGDMGATRVEWTRSWGEGVHATPAAGETARLFNGLVLNRGETVIVAEASYEFHPLFDGVLLERKQLKKHAQMRPRFGGLDRIEP